MRTLSLGPSVELPIGRNTREACAKNCAVTHATPAIGAFGGAPYGATILVRGVQKWTRSRMRTRPLGPSVELPMGPRSVVLGGGDACERGHWGLP